MFAFLFSYLYIYLFVLERGGGVQIALLSGTRCFPASWIHLVRPLRPVCSALNPVFVGRLRRSLTHTIVNFYSKVLLFLSCLWFHQCGKREHFYCAMLASTVPLQNLLFFHSVTSALFSSSSHTDIVAEPREQIWIAEPGKCHSGIIGVPAQFKVQLTATNLRTASSDHHLQSHLEFFLLFNSGLRSIHLSPFPELIF